ncbi:MAG: sugar ABC transporter permease [Alphaproteobacteria bacterium]
MRESQTVARRRRLAGAAFVAPALAVLAAVLGYPIVDSIVLAFQDVSMAAGQIDRTWNGLGNFERLFDDQAVHNALLNTLYFSGAEVVLVVGLGLGIALLLNNPIGRSGFLRVVLVVPWAIAPVANAVLWKWILNANYGVLNGVLVSLGILDTNQVWLGAPNMALGFLLLVDVWKSLPFVVLLMLAGLSQVPSILYRAAYLDGASRVQTFFHITLPNIGTALAIATVLQTIWSLRVFDLVFVLTRGGPADATVLLNFLAYRVTFNFLDLGYGAAIANLVFALTFALAILYIWLMRPRRAGRAA